MTEIDLNFGKRMDDLNDKELMIKKIVDIHPRRVLDLGAGTGLISKLISDHDIYVDSVDRSFKSDDIEDTKYLKHYPCDIIRFLDMTTKKYDCIILSAILHELSPYERKQLYKGLRKVRDKSGCTLVIREPYYEEKRHGLVRPFKSLDIQKQAYELACTYIPEIEILKWEYLSKKHQQFNSFTFDYDDFVPDCVVKLNLAFAWSYGDQSWPREISEYRYAYSKKELIAFAKKCLGRKLTYTCYEHYDKDYIKYFKQRNIDERLIKGIEYTNCFIIFKK